MLFRHPEVLRAEQPGSGRSRPRHEDEVREKMKELGLVAQTGKRGNVRVVR